MLVVIRCRVFENRLSGRIFGPKRDEVTGKLRSLHIEKLYDLYSSPNIIWAIKSRRTRWAVDLALDTGLYYSLSAVINFIVTVI